MIHNCKVVFLILSCMLCINSDKYCKELINTKKKLSDPPRESITTIFGVNYQLQTMASETADQFVWTLPPIERHEHLYAYMHLSQYK